MEEEVPTCPLCLEDLDATDRAMRPCKCSYVVCCWCLNHIRERLNGLCPACRTPYEEQNFTFEEVSTEAALKEAKERANAKKEREKREKMEELERERARAQAMSQQKAKTNLKHARFVQRNLVYVSGLSLTLAREECLRRQDMFGRFGRLLRVLVNKAHSYNTDAPGGPSKSAYLQFARDIDASSAARNMNNAVFDGRELRCAIATNKYCDTFVRNGVNCGNKDCIYIHEIVASEESLSREEVLARQLGPPPPGYLFLPARRRDAVQQVNKAPNVSTSSTVKPMPDATPQQAMPTSSSSSSSSSSSTVVGSRASHPDPMQQVPAAHEPSRSVLRALDPAESSTQPMNGRSVSKTTTVLSSATSMGLPAHSKHTVGVSSQPNQQSSLSERPVDMGHQRLFPDTVPLAMDATSHGSAAKSEVTDDPKLLAPLLPDFAVWDEVSPSKINALRSPVTASSSAPNTPSSDDDKVSRKQRSSALHDKPSSAPHAPVDHASQKPKSQAHGQNPPPGFGQNVTAFTQLEQLHPPGFGVPPVHSGYLGDKETLQAHSIHNSGSVSQDSSLFADAHEGASAAYAPPPGFAVPVNFSSSKASDTAGAQNHGRESATAWSWGLPSSSGDAIKTQFDVLGDEIVERHSARPRIGSPRGNAEAGITKSAHEQHPDDVTAGTANPDVVFSGRGIALPPISIEAPFRSSGLRPSAQFPLQALGELGGIPASEADKSAQEGILSREGDNASVSVAPVLRPSRRSNSRFGFARGDSPACSSSVTAGSTPNLERSNVFDSDGNGMTNPGNRPELHQTRSLGASLVMNDAMSFGGKRSKPSRSRFDFVERDADADIRTQNTSPNSSTHSHANAALAMSDAKRLPSNSELTPFAFSQLSTEDKLASLFQSAQLAPNSLPPMPSIISRQPFEQELGLHSRTLLTEKRGSDVLAVPDSVPAVPPGFRGVTDGCLSGSGVLAAATATSSAPREVGEPMLFRQQSNAPADKGSLGLKQPVKENTVPEGNFNSVDSFMSNGLSCLDSGQDHGGVVQRETQRTTFTPAEKVYKISHVAVDEETSREGLSDGSDQQTFDTELSKSEDALVREVQAAQARKAELTAQLSDLQQQIRFYDNRRT